VNDCDARRLAGVEEANAFNIDEIDLPQIQLYVWSPMLNFRFQLFKVLGAKLTAQTNARSATTGNSIYLQHPERWSELRFGTIAIVGPFVIPGSKGT